jgi:hypothetical protein
MDLSMSRSTTIVESLVIPHTAFAEAERQIEQCFVFSAAKGEAEGLAIIGESGTGKTSVLNEFRSRHKAIRGNDGMQVPVLFASVPSAPTVKSLAGTMLDALGVPDPERGTENEKTRRLRILMRETGTKMVMIDEFQHFVDQGTHKVMHHVADWLKRLIDDTRSTLVIAGLPSCMAVIDQNTQLARRFLAPIQLPRFQWINPAQRKQFVSILRSFHTEISKDFDLPDLSSEDMAYRLYLATVGLMNHVAKLLRQALRNTPDQDRPVITLNDLNIAHMQAIWSIQRIPGLPKPFEAKFRVEKNMDILDQVSRIGIVNEDLVVVSRRGANRGQEKSLSDILVAK